jgi:predicted O-linked N-acetylglucosamine transferase (SPINDLY family)
MSGLAPRLHRRPGRRPVADAGALHRDAIDALRAGRLDDAARLLAAAIDAAPHVPEPHANLGLVLLALGRAGEAETSCRRAVALRGDLVAAHVNLGNALRVLGRPDEAAASYRRALALDPTLAEAHNNLGVVLAARGDRDGAKASYTRALALRGDYAEAHVNLGAALWADGDAPAAVASYRAALALRPHDAETHNNLGVALAALGELDTALASLDRAIALHPGYAEAHANRGNAMRARGDTAAAMAAYVRALELRPDLAELHANVASLLLAQGGVDDALGRCRRALELAPDLAVAHAVLGNVLADRGDLPAAVAALERAVALEPTSAEHHANLIFVLDLDARTTEARALAERRRWNERHARPHARRVERPDRDPDPARRLRVGYVSADFKRHSAAAAFGPVLLHHDPAAVEVTCYSGVVAPDDLTERFRRAAARWRPINGLSDDAVARMIADDAIDVLVDLSGYSAGTRLAVFGRRPAPVQVTAWGHALGTGLDAMDYFLADPVAVPAALRASLVERVVDLPSLIPYGAPPDAPPVAELPARSRGHVTFGSFNRPAKLGRAVLELWADVLAGLPGSRLLLKYTGLDAPATAGRLRAVLAARGVDPDRLELRGGSSQAEHLAAYGDVDIALDPFPHGGGVTALEGLWMGVPLITRLGERVPGRLGASFLERLGLDDWIATGPDEYVRLAVEHARDLARLARLRGELRARLAASPIGDATAYCRAVEAAYRAMWRSCCERGARDRRGETSA